MASLCSVVGLGWSAPVSKPHCVRSLVKQVGESASSGKSHLGTGAEDSPNVFPGVVFEVILNLGGGLTAQFVPALGQRVINGCPRRTRASDGAAEDRPRGHRGGGGVLQ